RRRTGYGRLRRFSEVNRHRIRLSDGFLSGFSRDKQWRRSNRSPKADKAPECRRTRERAYRKNGFGELGRLLG
ncbi:hypothetical protein LINPERHAP1_LOCUS20413, partial [Linum perenne]